MLGNIMEAYFENTWLFTEPNTVSEVRVICLCLFASVCVCLKLWLQNFLFKRKIMGRNHNSLTDWTEQDKEKTTSLRAQWHEDSLEPELVAQDDAEPAAPCVQTDCTS